MQEQLIRIDARLQLLEQQCQDYDRNIKELESYVPGWLKDGISTLSTTCLTSIAHKIEFYKQMIWTTRSDIERERSLKEEIERGQH